MSHGYVHLNHSPQDGRSYISTVRSFRALWIHSLGSVTTSR